jgi:hypothetical protein
MGRPTKYTEALGIKICNEIASTSKGLDSICKNVKYPSSVTVYNWLNDKDKEEFFKRYTCAREAQADLLADQIISIADDHKDDTIINPASGTPQINAEWVARCRLQVDARKWKASKLAPKKYGDKVDVTTGGDKINTLPITGIDINRPDEATGS